MFELKRSPRIREDIKIGDEIITIDIDPEAIALEFNKRQNEIIKAEAELRQAVAETDKLPAMAKYGEAVVMLFGLIFGEDNAAKIVKFYEGRYMEMSLEVFPFIIEDVKPAMAAAAKQMRKRAAEQYKYSR